MLFQPQPLVVLFLLRYEDHVHDRDYHETLLLLVVHFCVSLVPVSWCLVRQMLLVLQLPTTMMMLKMVHHYHSLSFVVAAVDDDDDFRAFFSVVLQLAALSSLLSSLLSDGPRRFFLVAISSALINRAFTASKQFPTPASRF
jgi:hypothetical protein